MIANNLMHIFITYYASWYSFTNISLHLIILNTVVGLIANFNYTNIDKVFLKILHFIITISFIIDSLWLFYISFELLLLPIFYCIYYSNQTYDSIYVCFKFLYFTLSTSLLWLLALLMLFFINGGSMDIISFWYAGLFLIALLVKLPMPPFHLWLNDTHTASPVSSSILLAGTVLKISVYGIIIWYVPLFRITLVYFMYIITSLAVVGAIYTSLACIRQIDYKRLIAYTSIGHMNLALFAILPILQHSTYAAFVLLISHGLISSLLFYHVNSLYKRFYTKIIVYLTGISTIMPISALLGLILHISNFSFPPALSWYAELFIFFNGFVYYPIVTYVIASIILISMIYTLWTYFRIYLGHLNPCLTYSYDNTNNSNYFISYTIVLIFISWYFILSIE